MLVSLLVHAGLAWLATRGVVVPARRARRVEQAQPTTPPHQAEPIEVVFVDPEEPLPATSDVARMAVPQDGGSGRAVATRAPAAAAPSSPAGAAAPRGEREAIAASGGPGHEAPARASGTRSLAMRGPNLALSSEFLERIARESRAPEAVTHSGRLGSAGGGKATIEDRVTTVHVAPDGTATFDDKSDFDLHFDLPTPGRLDAYRLDVGRQIAKWYEDPEADRRVGDKDDVPVHLEAHPGDCDHWGDECNVEMRARDRSAGEGLVTPIWGKAEISDAILRRFGIDPYASRKRKLLDDTRGERAAMGAAHRAEDLARSAELTQRNLLVLWRTTSDPAVRRDVLFAMWDECIEGDDAAGEAGQRARFMVIGWIRAKLPAGSPGAFTPEEIAARSAHRQSRQPFAPYE